MRFALTNALTATAPITMKNTTKTYISDAEKGISKPISKTSVSIISDIIRPLPERAYRV